MPDEPTECLIIGVRNQRINGKNRLVYHFRLQENGEYVDHPPIDWPASNHDIPPDPASIDTFEEWAWRKVPDDIAKALRKLMAKSLATNGPIWLHYDRPRAHLALAPWEMLLQPVFGCPVLKRPLLKIPPTRLPGRAVFAICGSTPVAKSAFGLVELIERSVRRFLEAVKGTREIHVFVDEGHTQSVTDALSGHRRPGLDIIVHNPLESAPTDAPDRDSNLPDTKGEITNPWMVWIANALAGKRVDAISFCCHGYYRHGRGAIAFSESPRFNYDLHWSRFVAGEEISGLLDRLGARFLILESPPRNFSAPGLMATADIVRQLRPGPVAIHDSSADPELDALLDAFDHILGLGWNRRPSSPALSLTVSPMAPRSAAEAVRSVVQNAYKGKGSKPERPPRFPIRGGVLGPTSSPTNDDAEEPAVVEQEYGGWVAASRRRVERSWASETTVEHSDSEVAKATRTGVADALSFIEELMAKHGGGDVQ